jgi:hypothetical protein
LLRNRDRYAFAPELAVAFGDNPSGNDEPLTRFGAQGMPFVSVGEDTPEHLLSNHVGGFEFGTALVIGALLAADAAGGGGNAPQTMAALLPSAITAARQAAREPHGRL